MALLFIGWSILEGFGATLVMPAIQTLVTSNYSGKDRALAYGIIGGIVAGAIALGPIIGGWLTTWYTWRLAFAGEVVIVIIVLILSRYILDAPLETEERPKLDIIGTIFSALGVGLIVFGVLLAGVYGWWKARQPYYIGGVEISPLGLSPTPVFIFTGVIILLFFAFWERHVISRGKMPLIRLDVLRDRGGYFRSFHSDGSNPSFWRFPVQHGSLLSGRPGPQRDTDRFSLPPPLPTSFNCFACSIPVIFPHGPKDHYSGWATHTYCGAFPV